MPGGRAWLTAYPRTALFTRGRRWVFSEVGKASCGILLGVLLVHPPDRLGLGSCEIPPLLRVVYGVEEVGVGHVAQTEHHPSLVAAAQITAQASSSPWPPSSESCYSRSP